MARLSNSLGNTNRDVRKFLRENGVPATVDNVERIGAELRRTESQNEAVEREAIERGHGGLRDHRGDVESRVKRRVLDDVRGRDQRRQR